MFAVRGLRSRKGAAEGSRRCVRRRVKNRKRSRYRRRMVLRESDNLRVGDLCRGTFFCPLVAVLRGKKMLCQYRALGSPN